jgi:hypothetical protein
VTGCHVAIDCGHCRKSIFVEKNIMTAPEAFFTRELMQAVNDWQRGGGHDQKVRRGRRLKECAALLPTQFRICGEVCFRQEAHEKDRIWQLLADRRLPETIAAWTMDLDVAKTFKGGVPPPGLQGVIFSLVPPAGSVVLNLVTLYADPAFRAAVEAHKADLIGLADGIGRWDISQIAVILVLARKLHLQVLEWLFFPDTGRKISEYLPIASGLIAADSAAHRIALNQSERLQKVIFRQHVQVIAVLEQLHNQNGRDINVSPDFGEHPRPFADGVAADAEGGVVPSMAHHIRQRLI